MSNPIVLANKDLTQDQIISADEEHGQFVDQPQAASGNTGDLSLTSSGDYTGTAELDLVVIIKTAGDPGTSKFLYSDDSKVTHYGMNPKEIWTDLEVIKSSI